MIDVEATTEALHDLRRARRSNRLADVHWIDALYRVYMVALVGVLLVMLASGQLPDDRLTNAEALTFANEAPMWLGLFFAGAVGIGLRSGGRGGPLVLEAPVVMHELNAPVPRAAVVRGPAVKQLRFLAFAGALVGALVGELSARQLPVNVVAAVACCSLAFALAGMLASATAMAVSGRRLRWWPANGIALLLIGWSVLDVVGERTTSPLTMLADIAFWPIEFRIIGLVGVALVVLVVVLAFTRLGDLSVEHALRRAGLVAQLRFAVTLQDVRTVVLLRRQLSQEMPRLRPWVRIGRARRRTFVPVAWKRDWQSYLRFPLPRLVRMAGLGIVAGLSLGVMWRGTIPAVVIAGLALYLAAYDAAEPTAQEVDHPTRWESYPESPGRLLLHHLAAAFVVMVVVCLFTGVAALALVPWDVVWKLWISLVIPVAGAAAVSATISTSQGAPNVAGLAGLGPDIMGWVMLARVVIPPAITVVALLPLLGAGSDADQLQTTRVGNASVYALFLAGLGMLYIYTRKPKHL
ncbi:MAG TPA: hypothetical protein VIY72_17615 [Acidimicrobiales bacterium]